MANRKFIHELNTSGSLFVDNSCIDCGTCYHLAPDIFAEDQNKSYVKEQPETYHEWSQAKAALVSCPTNSIGVTDAPKEFREAKFNLPLLIAEKVYYCGYTSQDSFGASSYLIERKDGNILIDSPRFHPTLVKELEEMGGVRWMILTHRDDVADHEKFHQHFKCDRIIHREEVSGGTKNAEIILNIDGPFKFFEDLTIIPTPGHTQGHINILYKGEFLFTGDHIFFDPSTNHVLASRDVCWYSWPKQIESTRKLEEFQFEWILPGHGGWGWLDGPHMKQEIHSLVERMEKNERIQP